MRVNGEVARIGSRANPDADEITVDGRAVHAAPPVYLMMHKPAGYACTRHDPHLPRTVYQLLPRGVGGVYTVGRLDVDTTGLLLLTNDGEWANAIAHPRRHVPKTYIADVRGSVTRAALDALRRGVRLEDGPTLPADVRLEAEDPDTRYARLRITITEGRKRQVRRMLTAVGLDVVRLTRSAIGPLTLAGLPPGRWRALEAHEVDALRRASEE